MIFGQIKTRNYDLSIHNRRQNRLVHSRYLVKSKLCNVTDLSALLFFCGRRPLPFGGSHLRLPSGPAGIRTTTGSLSALARPTPYQLSHRAASDLSALLGRPFRAKPVLRRFSGPRIGFVGASFFIDFVPCWGKRVVIRCCLNPVEVSFLLFGFVWWLDCLLLKRRPISILQC